MKTLLCFFALGCFCGDTPAQRVSSATAACTPVPFKRYQAGMRFYFPAEPPLLATNRILDGFSSDRAVDAAGVRYGRLAGRTLEIAGPPQVLHLASYFPNDYWRITYRLRDVRAADTFYFSGVLDTVSTPPSANPQLLANDTLITGGVYLGDVEQARRELVGKTFYTRFALRGKRFEPVTITRVEPGTWEAALRLHLRSKEISDTTVDVNRCGTNVFSSHREAYRIGNFLTETLPRAGLGSPSDDWWEAIRTGNVRPGMTTAQVEEALGKPQKIIKLISPNKTRFEYVYDDQHLLFEDGRLVIKPD